jgi:adenylate cyclase
MGEEIERKFLVKGAPWRSAGEGVRYRQGYLCLKPERTVRVRMAGQKGFLTIKGPDHGGVRSEYEYPIPAADALSLLEGLCEKPLIEKVRYRLPLGGHVWELDVFAGENEGLATAEVELTRSDEVVEIPDWAGREVTGDPRYANANLVRHPFSTWRPR